MKYWIAVLKQSLIFGMIIFAAPTILVTLPLI